MDGITYTLFWYKIRKHWQQPSWSHKLKGYPIWGNENCQCPLHYNWLYYPLVQKQITDVYLFYLCLRYIQKYWMSLYLDKYEFLKSTFNILVTRWCKIETHQQSLNLIWSNIVNYQKVVKRYNLLLGWLISIWNMFHILILD